MIMTVLNSDSLRLPKLTNLIIITNAPVDVVPTVYLVACDEWIIFQRVCCEVFLGVMMRLFNSTPLSFSY